MEYSRFAVGEVPYCVWDWDLSSINRRYLRQIDPDYFEYVAKSHFDGLATEEDAHRAATALRMAYYHGLETLFALVCAGLQAPDCVVGWMQQYHVTTLRTLVGHITDQSQTPLTKFRLHDISWELISDLVHTHSAFSTRHAETVEAFAVCWRRLAYDFLNPSSGHEYNSIKHGFRANAGGFSLRIGRELEYGIEAPPEEMQTLGGSEFGHSYFVAEGIGATRRRHPHFRLVHHSANWRPEAVIQALQLISMSINNVQSFLRIVNGADPSELPFIRPEDPAAFDGPWSWSVGVMEMQSKTQIEEGDIEPFSPPEILSVYEGSDSTTDDDSQTSPS